MHASYEPSLPPPPDTQVVIDQLVFAPIATLFFYAYKCATEGRPG